MSAVVSEATAEDPRRVMAEALSAAGLAPAADAVQWLPLAGGVSNDVFLAEVGTQRFVVKRALATLRVAERWDASPERSFTEAAAITWAGAAAPERVPSILAVDRDRNVIVETCAPDGWENWKVLLLRGEVNPWVGSQLGAALAVWQTASAADPAVAEQFGGAEAFRQLRVDPFYSASAARNPSVAEQIDRLVRTMSQTRTVLVHGDYSPKNVLTGDSGLWVIDWEVAHLGDPVFDVAFLLHHLLCKAIALPGSARELEETADAFLDGYNSRGASEPIPSSYLAGHTAALLLARIDGKSPVEYLSSSQREVGRRIAVEALAEGAEDISQLWRMVHD